MRHGNKRNLFITTHEPLFRYRFSGEWKRHDSSDKRSCYFRWTCQDLVGYYLNKLFSALVRYTWQWPMVKTDSGRTGEHASLSDRFAAILIKKLQVMLWNLRIEITKRKAIEGREWGAAPLPSWAVGGRAYHWTRQGQQLQQDITGTREHKTVLQYTSRWMTGLPNQAFFMERLRLALTVLQNDGRIVIAVLFLDRSPGC